MARRFRSFKSRTQIQRAMSERRANADAANRGKPMPYPNIWDALDPTKLPRDATQEQILARIAAFRKICRPPVRKRHPL
jgi:hypothetical protein